jgi:hypothetical protein
MNERVQVDQLRNARALRAWFVRLAEWPYRRFPDPRDQELCDRGVELRSRISMLARAIERRRVAEERRA